MRDTEARGEAEPAIFGLLPFHSSETKTLGAEFRLLEHQSA